MDGAVRVMTEQSPEVLRFYHFKEIACDATIASMFLMLYDTGQFLKEKLFVRKALTLGTLFFLYSSHNGSRSKFPFEIIFFL